MKAYKIIILFLYLLTYAIGNCQAQNDNRQYMIIVSPHEYISELSPFVEAKSHDFIDCYLIGIDSGETFNSIKLKIDKAYNQIFADYLLLVGDFEHLPAYIMNEGLSDIHYTFENENNTVPRMAVGRFSVENKQDLQTMINKSIFRKPFSGHLIGIASQEISELTQMSDYEQIRQMENSLQSKGFTSISELFDGSQGGVDKVGNPTYTDVLEALNQGSSWLNYAGYGSYEGWNTSGFEMKYIDSLHDNIELPIIVSASCLGGHFAGRTCFAEQWMRASKNGNPTGATAVIMSSSLTDWDATLSAMLIMAQNMPNSGNNCRLGNLYLQAYSHIVEQMHRPKDAACWILFGDPSLWIFPPANNSIASISVSSLKIYPNPAHDIISVDIQDLNNIISYQLFDIQGKKIEQGILEKENSFINIHNLDNGIYFIRFTDGKQLYKIEKIIKE